MVAFGALTPFNKIFNVAPRSSAWGFWQTGALSAALVGVIATVALGILKQSSVVLGVITTVLSLAAAYAFRKIYEVEEKRIAAEKAPKPQEPVRAEENEVLRALQDQNGQLQRRLGVREAEILEIQGNKALVERDLEREKGLVLQLREQQGKDAATLEELRGTIQGASDILTPLLLAFAPQLEEMEQPAIVDQDDLTQKVNRVKAVLELLMAQRNDLVAEKENLAEQMFKAEQRIKGLVASEAELKDQLIAATQAGSEDVFTNRRYSLQGPKGYIFVRAPSFDESTGGQSAVNARSSSPEDFAIISDGSTGSPQHGAQEGAQDQGYFPQS